MNGVQQYNIALHWGTAVSNDAKQCKTLPYGLQKLKTIQKHIKIQYGLQWYIMINQHQHQHQHHKWCLCGHSTEQCTQIQYK